MKIAFVSTLYAPNERGGAERTVRILAESLVARGHEAVVISLAPDGVARTDSINGVKTYYVPLANIFWKQSEDARNALARMTWHLIDSWTPMMAGRVAKILKLERPDLVQTGNLQGFSVSLWRAVRKLGIPLVQMLHDYYLGCPKSTMVSGTHNCEKQCGMCRLFTAPRRRYSHLPAAVISLSRRMLSRLEGTGLFAQVDQKYIIHGVNNSQIVAKHRANRAPGSPIVIGYLGRMENTKGIDVLLDAVKRMNAEQVTVLLGGKGDEAYVADLQRTYAAPNVTFLGFVRPAEFFERIDALVVPSVWEEPLGRVIYEGYAHGIPALVSSVGGMPEIVEHGRTGFVFTSENATELADILQKEIDAGWRAEQFSAACVEASKRFGVEKIFEEYVRVWEAAMRAPVRASTAVLPYRDSKAVKPESV
ncbi:MAG: glycosyltransferase family 4 protein [Povalibacter sp.]